MSNGRESIGTNGVGSLFPTGTAYVCIPDNQDRTKFIQRCLKTQTLFIRGENGESFKNVFCSKTIIKDIEFPETAKERGTLVAWIKQPKHNHPIIIAALDLKTAIGNYYQERQIKFTKTNKAGSIVDIDGRVDDGILDISVVSTEDGKGKIRLKVANPDSTAKMEVYVSGEADLYAENKIKLQTKGEFLIELLKDDGTVLANASYKAGTGFKLKDEYNNEIVTANQSVRLKEGTTNGLELELTNSLLYLGKIGGTGTEFVLLGSKTEDVINTIKSILNSINSMLSTVGATDATVASGLGLTYAAAFTTLAGTLTTALSTLTTQITLIKSAKVKTL